MDTKKILYRLLKGRTPISFSTNTLTYEITVNDKPMSIVISWYRSDKKPTFNLITPNRQEDVLCTIYLTRSIGEYIIYKLIIEGHEYNVELDNIETDEVNLLVSTVMKEYQEKMFDDIGKAFFEPDPVYGDLLNDEKQ